MSKKVYVIVNEITRQKAIDHIDNPGKYKVIIEEIKDDEKQRTLLQNAALHKDFASTAKVCNDNGITAASLFAIPREGSPVTLELVKEFWHNVLVTMGLPPKTSKLTTKQVTEIREGIERAFATRRYVDIGDFPSMESLMRQSIDYDQ